MVWAAMQRLVLLLLVAAVAFSGCLASAGPGAAPASGSAASGTAWTHAVDWTDGLVEGEVRLLALRATQPTDLRWKTQSDMDYQGNVASHVDLLWFDAPVEGLQARARGEDAVLPTRPGAGNGGGGCSGPTYLGVRAAGEQVVAAPSTCSGSTAGAGEGGWALAPGEWILFGAGPCGFGQDDVADGDVWRLDLSADHALEVVELPAAPVACGFGFEDHYDTNILGVHSGDAKAMMPVVYGGSVWMHSWQRVDGDWHVGGQVVPMREGMTAHTSALRGEVGFTVRNVPSQAYPLWTMVGI